MLPLVATWTAVVPGCGPGRGWISDPDTGEDRPVDDGVPRPWDCDNDNDGYQARPCIAVPAEADCDDADPTVHPHAIEDLDGADDDCDGDVDEDTPAWDADGDCVCADPVCTGSANGACLVVSGGDCDDTDPELFPGNDEVCDGLDNNCDQVVDDGLPVLTWWVDLDADGFGSQVAAPAWTCGDPPVGRVANNADCDDLHANVGPFLEEIPCDGLDNDCNAATRDGDDHDEDGVIHCFDCDDDDPTRSPALEEVCDDQDNDCDGEADDGLDFDEYWPDNDGDGYGNGDADEIDACRDPPGWVEDNDDCNDSNYWVNPSAYDWHCDGVDNDCEDGDTCP